MSRAPFQVIVFPFRLVAAGVYEFAAFRRSDADYWQGVAGGGEDDESPSQAARREAKEEAGLGGNRCFVRLDSMCMVPVYHFAARMNWPEHLYVIPEYAFAVDASGVDLVVSLEHVEITWGSYAEIAALLHWDSNKTALWELNERLTTGQLPGS